jgi:hypothetical protein
MMAGEMSKIEIRNNFLLERARLPEGTCDLVVFRCPGLPPPVVCEPQKVQARLDVVCHEVEDPHPRFQAPTLEMARGILKWIEDKVTSPVLVISDEAGTGRAQALMAALLRIQGQPNSLKSLLSVKRAGVYNRLLYRYLLEAYGLPAEPEPLVSVAISVYWPPEYLTAFMLSMLRQRHKNWEVVGVTDGPCPDVEEDRYVREKFIDTGRLRLVRMDKHKGNWCHHYRQLALQECLGKYVTMSNDDNLYVPGFMEQMVLELEDGADLVLCHHLHSYYGWSHTGVSLDQGSNDLGCWMARADLIRACPWSGTGHQADGAYVNTLVTLIPDDKVHDKIRIVPRPLFIKN